MLRMISIGLIFLFSLVTFCFSVDNEFIEIKASDTRAVSYDNHLTRSLGTADPEPIQFMGRTWTSGFTLQPHDLHLSVGQKSKLVTDTYLTWGDGFTAIPMGGYQYQWYKSTDKKDWQKVENEKKQDLAINTDKETPRITYYQLEYSAWYYIQWPLLTGSWHSWYPKYSKIATVTVESEPKDAREVKVRAKNPYLFNNQSESVTTYAESSLEPSNSTAQLDNWSIDNTSLAKIDSQTGLITANNSEESGTVKITAKYKNSKGKFISGSGIVQIGGGLNDQYVSLGQEATFKVLGTNGYTPDSVEWYQIKDSNNPNSKGELIPNQHDLALKTPQTRKVDNEIQYYAVIKMTEDVHEGLNGAPKPKPKQQTVTTRKAKLHVLVPSELSTTIINNTRTDFNDETNQLMNVLPGDDISIKGEITSKDLKNVKLKMNIPGSIGKPTVMIDNKPIDFDLTKNSDETDYSTITIKSLKFSPVDRKKFEVRFVLDKNSIPFFKVKPIIYDNDSDFSLESNEVTGIMKLDELTVVPGNFSFGEFEATDNDQLLNGKLVDGSEKALTVFDERWNKKPVQIQLTQTNPFRDQGGAKLNSELRLYKDKTIYQSFQKGPIPITSTREYETVPSISWTGAKGLKLNVEGGSYPSGQYQTTLTWNIIEST